jgi:hypothetical protein
MAVAAAEEDEVLQSIFRVSPTRLVTRSRSSYSRSGIAYFRVT